MAGALFLTYLHAGLAGGGLILAALAVRFIFRRMPAGFRCALWFIVALRLLIPFSAEAPFAVLPAARFPAKPGLETAMPRTDLSEYPMTRPMSGQQEIGGTALTAPSDAAPYPRAVDASESGAGDPLFSFLPKKTDIRRVIAGALPALWLAGAAGMLCYMLLGALRLSRAVRFAVPEDRELTDLKAEGMAAARQTDRERVSVRVYRADAIDTPFLFGLFRPRIYIPCAVREADLDHIIRHELAHRKRRDHLLKPLFFLALALHWYNPPVWVAFWLLGRDMEEACDNRVIDGYADKDRRAYADALLAVASGRRGLDALSVAFGEIPVRGRVEHIFVYRRAGRALRGVSAALCLLLCALFFTERAEATDGLPERARAIETELRTEDTVRVGRGLSADELPDGGAGSEPQEEETAGQDEEPSGYLPLRSANYRLEPDDENGGYRLYDRSGAPLGGLIEYADVVAAEDAESGERWLFSKYADFNAYQVTPLTQELEADLREAMDLRTLYIQPLAAYRITTDEATGLQYILRNGHRRWEGHVLLWNERDRAAYDALAADYDARFMEVFLEAGVGYIYADMEVKGLCFRYDGGFVQLGTGQLQSVNLKNPEEGFLLALTNEEYDRLADWLETHRDTPGDRSQWSWWMPALDALDIDYDRPYDVNSPRYQAAVAWLEQSLADYGGFPPEGMSGEQIERNIRNKMKQFDEDGDPVAFGSLPGMMITSGDGSDRRELIDVPEKDREALFSLIRAEYMQWDGQRAPVADAWSEIYHTYQVEAKKADRLKGTWTLQQYERMYEQAFVAAIRRENPGWEEGDPFDLSLVAPITREQIEARLISDGQQFALPPGEDTDE